MFKPLEGVRIIDLTQVLAGPYSTYQLALLGADVIKIEPPGQGDWTRVDPTSSTFPGMGLSYMTQGSNKQSVVLNLKTGEGLEVLKKLIATADIFVENFRPGTAARLGVSFDDVKAVNDRIIYASISAYGQDGPNSARPAYDHVVQGMCGIMTTTGTDDTVPNKVGAPYVDYATGLNAAFAILSAWMQGQKDGKAHRVDVAMLDTAMLMMSSMITMSDTLGTVHGAYGNEAHSRSPSSGAFATTDGTLMIAANNERQFRSMCSALDREDILDDARWKAIEDRGKNREALRAEIEKQIKTSSADYWEQRFADHDVPAARVRRVDEVLKEEQLKARGVTMATRVPGIDQDVYLPRIGFKVDSDGVGPDRAPPRHGADTESVLKSLGLGSDELKALLEKGVIETGSAS